MEQFNFEKYLKNPKLKIVTRDGRSARIICTDRKSKVLYDGPILALVDEIKEGREYCYAYSSDGKAYESESDADLFFVLVKKVGWMNLYNRGFGLVNGGEVYNSEEEAKKIAAEVEDYITTIKVEWEE